MNDQLLHRVVRGAVTAMVTVAAVAACVQFPTVAGAAPPVPPGPSILTWYRIDPTVETACTVWGDRLYRTSSGASGGYSITVAPSTGEDYPCGLRSQNDPNYGPGVNP